VLDLIYNRTRLLRDAQSAGDTVLNGELMLLHQGAAAFTLWTGQPAPLELMQERLAAARAGGLRSAEGEPAGAEPAGMGADAPASAGTEASGPAPSEASAPAPSEASAPAPSDASSPNGAAAKTSGTEGSGTNGLSTSEPAGEAATTAAGD
jgi:shikimate 5'-dehydrogenase-like protein